MWWWLLLPPTCLVSEVGGTGARVVAIGAPNLAGVGGWGHGCTWCGHRCPEPGGSAGTCRSTVAERPEGQGACARIELRVDAWGQRRLIRSAIRTLEVVPRVATPAARSPAPTEAPRHSLPDPPP